MNNFFEGSKNTDELYGRAFKLKKERISREEKKKVEKIIWNKYNPFWPTKKRLK